MGNNQSSDNKKSISLLKKKIDEKMGVITSDNTYVKKNEFNTFKQTVNSNFTIIGKTAQLIPSEINL
jgi:hypothetical protein